MREDTHLAHFFRVGVLAESSDDHLEQLLCRLRLLHQICRRSAAWTDTVRTYSETTRRGTGTTKVEILDFLNLFQVLWMQHSRRQTHTLRKDTRPRTKTAETYLGKHQTQHCTDRHMIDCIACDNT